MKEKVKTYTLTEVDGKVIRSFTGEMYERDSEWRDDQKDYYIVGINNWIINPDGLFLVQRRALTKKNNPGKWSSTNGLIQAEEENYETVQRETYEELGININKDQVFLVEANHLAGSHLVVDIFVSLLDKDIAVKDIKKQDDEVDLISYVTLEQLLDLDISTTCSYIKDLAPKMYEIYLQRHSTNRY